MNPERAEMSAAFQFAVCIHHSEKRRLRKSFVPEPLLIMEINVNDLSPVKYPGPLLIEIGP